MREVQEKLYDDLLFKQNGEKVEANETVEFSIDGQPFTIDLTGDNAELFREQFRPFKEAATPVTKRTGGSSKKKGGGSSTTSAPTASPKKPSTGKETDEQNRQIREWARNNGFDLSDRGRLPKHVQDAYWEAQHGANPGQVVQDQLTEETPPAEPTFDAVEDSGPDEDVAEQVGEVERV